MRLTGTFATLLLAQTALFVCAGCDSQVSNKYQGESLLTIRGSVVQSGAVTSDLVPVLGFSDNTNYTPDNTRKRWIIDGHVTGEFPAKFQVDFTEPPPDITFSPNAGRPEGWPWNQGEFYLVPRNHPSAYPEYVIETERVPALGTGGCDAGDNCSGDLPDSSPYVERSTVCESENHCKVTTYQCHNEPCQLIYSAGDPALQTSDLAARHHSEGAYAQGTLQAQTYYDQEDINHSYRAVYFCDDLWKVPTPGGYGGLSVDSHGIPANRYCTPFEKTGEDFPDSSAIPWRASTFFVVYARQDGLYFPGGDLTRSTPLTRGYNVIKAKTILSEDESIAAVNCLEDLEVTAINEINAKYGTHYVPRELFFEYPDEFPIQEFLRREEELIAQCPEMTFKWYTVSPSDLIEIELGPPSMSDH